MRILLLISIVLCFSFSTFGNECSQYLDLQIEDRILEIPGRGNVFRRVDYDKMIPLNQYRVMAIAQALAILNEEDIVIAVQSMNQPLSYFLKPEEVFEAPPELKDIIKGHPLEHQILENYTYFASVLRNEPYSKQTLAGLSLIFYQITRPKRPVISYSSVGIDDPNHKNYELHYHHIRRLIHEPKVARMVIAFFKHPEVKARTQEALELQRDEFRAIDEIEFNKIISKNPNINIESLRARSEKQIAEETTLNVERIETEFNRNRKFSKASQIQIALMLITFSDLIDGYYNFRIKQFHYATDRPDTNVFNFKDLHWSLRLQLIEDYLADTLGFKSGLYDISTLLDHVRYGSVLPISNATLESSVQQALKLWLIPARSEVIQFNIKDREAQSKEVHFDSVFVNHLYNNNNPTHPNKIRNSQPQNLNPNKRKNQRGGNNTIGHETAEYETGRLIPFTTRIPDAINLIHFTEFSDQPKSLDEIQPDTSYKFRFMRLGDDSKIESITFPESVLKDLLKEKDAAEHLMRAFILGPARVSNQDGVKILKRKHTSVDGRYYEVKSTKTAYRIILLHQEDRWTAVVFTDKNNFDRIQNTQL